LTTVSSSADREPPLATSGDQGEWRLRARVEGAVPRGEVTLDVCSSRAAIDDLVARLRRLSFDVQPERLSPAPPRCKLLTPAQDAAVRLAHEEGYYRVPRTLHLAELAAKGGISPAAMSERLRRAEARIIAHYVVEESAQM
jgi:predicted DNA binding protein